MSEALELGLTVLVWLVVGIIVGCSLFLMFGPHE